MKQTITRAGATANRKKGLIIVNTGDGKGKTTVILTWRDAKPEILEIADLATEALLKHPFEAGISAQKGIEF